MIRGVSKQIIEINETGNQYFERAVFYVRREYIGSTDDKLSEEAQRLLDVASKPPISAKCEKRRSAIMWGLIISSYPVLAAVVYLLARAG